MRPDPSGTSPLVDLLRRLGDTVAAAEQYRVALDRTANERERAFLRRRLAELSREE